MAMEILKGLLLEIKKIESIEALLHWDQETYMPEGSGGIRAQHISFLSSLAHKLHTSDAFRKELGNLVDMETGSALDQQADKKTGRLLYLIWKNYREASVLPESFVSEMALLASQSQQVWAKSREENDFDTFAPYLEKMVAMKKQEAEYSGYETTPYDSLLDKFEPDMTSAQLNTLFDPMRDRLVKLVKKIKESGTIIDENPLTRSFDIKEQWSFSMKVIEAMGFDLKTGRQDRSTHPFTTSFHPSDVRITTRLNANFFKTALFGSTHEAGHGLYEQGLPVKEYGTPLCDAVSLGFHESQSRLWENLIARGADFWNHFFPILKDHFKEPLKDINQETFYRMINTVTPSLIRVEADEVTYSLHIMLRFEIEKLLIDKNLSIKELPEVWNQKMRDYLGVVPENHKTGVMQDIHWSMGYFGYFPTYALGNMYAVPILEQARKDITEFDQMIKSGTLLPLKQWLYENIHCLGRRYTAADLMVRLTGKTLSAEPFLDYLTNKYSKIYRF
jgi:carboxypeptidase Taq